MTVWFGIWFLGPVALVFLGIDDPRGIFPNLFGLVGCAALAVGWLYIPVYLAIFDELPEFMTGC